MFSDNKKGKEPDLSNQQNRLSQGTKLVGDITSEGGFRIDGEVEGNITSPNKIVIGKTGVVTGTLVCNDADIEGRVEGKIEIKNLLSIKSTAQIEGEVITGKLAVEPSATFNASCVMKGSVKPLSKDGKGKKERSA
ncbi:polymer-forming cytoskeletal protein [Dokdonia sp. Hel_I_53]|uniref:bactofilin family protein n=1 Tax=Dokdonia sp. Hel_I_53 TaxID=1566287 RepID=UPI00119A6D0C|nr:polymer-forming cytoskeletal protein [Dokdonia sp. Hel_I_53]TVZ52700.1 cytoskeletal protein CcmA (bactofilin family) [Dokdonia sp. Hel_I_53]